MELTSDCTMNWALRELEREQNTLAARSCEATFRPKSRTLLVIRAKPGDTKIGLSQKMYDSPMTRELLQIAGFLVCEGQNISEFPDLVKALGTDRLPKFNPILDSVN